MKVSFNIGETQLVDTMKMETIPRSNEEVLLFLDDNKFHAFLVDQVRWLPPNDVVIKLKAK